MFGRDYGGVGGITKSEDVDYDDECINARSVCFTRFKKMLTNV